MSIRDGRWVPLALMSLIPNESSMGHEGGGSSGSSESGGHHDSGGNHDPGDKH